jgi:hypothetical protein
MTEVALRDSVKFRLAKAGMLWLGPAVVLVDDELVTVIVLTVVLVTRLVVVTVLVTGCGGLVEIVTVDV